MGAQYFDRLRLRHVRCFRDSSVPLDPQVTVVLGSNGSGKTTLVEALASLTGGPDEPPSEFPLRWGTRNAEIALFEDGGKRPVASWKVRSGVGALERLPEERYLFAYGRYRRVFYPEDTRETPSDPATDLDDLVNNAGRRRSVTLDRPDNRLLRDLSRYLAALHFGAEFDPRLAVVFRRLDESLAVLGQGITGITMEQHEYRYVPKVIRNGAPLELRELSDGYQSLLVVVFDLVLRYAYLFPSLEDPLKGQATVAIDEIDLHLHPRWQRTVIGQLIELFPRTQFILTTHSPAVVQGAIDLRKTVIALQEKAATVEAKPLGPGKMRGLRGAEIGALLLVDDLFGVESRYSLEYAQVEQRVAAMRAKIEKGTLTEDDEERLFKDLSTLKTLVAKDEERRADGSFMSQLADLRIALLRELAADLRSRRS